MSKSYDDLDKLFADLELEIQNSLKTDVAKEVKKVLKEHIQEDVYNQYDPWEYKRKEDDGGLLDDENIFADTISKDTLLVKSQRRNSAGEQSIGEGYESDRDIPLIVETGEGYNWGGIDLQGRTNVTPRPFTEKTIEDLEDNGQHSKALKKSLKSKGFDVK